MLLFVFLLISIGFTLTGVALARIGAPIIGSLVSVIGGTQFAVIGVVLFVGFV